MEVIEIENWKFTINNHGYIVIKDNRGIEYFTMVVRNSNKILIQKKGTTRFLRFPQFVINFVEEKIREKVGNNELFVINKSK
jgi:hypothetical protein